jgi:uncharacterized integral membrane protein
VLTGQTAPTVASKRRPSPRAILAVALSALLILFALLNSQTVTIHWILATTELPLIVVIAGCGLIGAAIGWLVARRQAARRNPS